MRSRLTTPVVLACAALITASCGSAAGPVARQSSAIGDTLPGIDEMVRPEPDVAGPLSIDDSLLDDADAPLPWESMHRTVDAVAYDIGPNQTDCDPYWQYERLGRLSGGEAMWWRDGGNLNHMVRRESGPGEAAALLEVLAALPMTCSVTSWSEGDSFTIDALDLGLDGVVALTIDHVRTDEMLWLAFAQRGDLISELRMTMWPEFATGEYPQFSVDDFASVASTMVDRLDAAGLESSPPPTPTPTSTPTTTEPGRAPIDGDEFPEVEIELPLDQLPPLPTPEIELPERELPVPTTIPFGPLASTLLTTDELPDRWVAGEPEVHEPSDDEDALAGCPASSVVSDADRMFEYSSDIDDEESDDWSRFGIQLVGTAPADVDPTELVALFLAMDGCTGTDEYATYSIAAREVGVDGADAAALVDVVAVTTDIADTPETNRNTLAVAVVGSTLTAFTLPSDAAALDFMQRAARKLVAADLD